MKFSSQGPFKNMFIPQKKMIKEQIEWLIDQKYLRRDEEDINTYVYVVYRTTEEKS